LTARDIKFFIFRLLHVVQCACCAVQFFATEQTIKFSANRINFLLFINSLAY